MSYKIVLDSCGELPENLAGDSRFERVPLGLEVGEYTSDFVCTKADGDLMVRECVYRKFLMKPLTVKLLDASRDYWLRHGVTDWGMVIDEEV